MANGQPDEVSVTTPLGSGTLRGFNLVVIVILLGACFSLVVLGLRDHQHITTSVDDLKGAVNDLKKEQQISNYLQSLPPDKRPMLIPPPGLWERLERGPATHNHDR